MSRFSLLCFVFATTYNAMPAVLYNRSRNSYVVRSSSGAIRRASTRRVRRLRPVALRSRASAAVEPPSVASLLLRGTPLAAWPRSQGLPKPLYGGRTHRSEPRLCGSFAASCGALAAAKRNENPLQLETQNGMTAFLGPKPRRRLHPRSPLRRWPRRSPRW